MYLRPGRLQVPVFAFSLVKITTRNTGAAMPDAGQAGCTYLFGLAHFSARKSCDAEAAMLAAGLYVGVFAFLHIKIGI